MYDDQSKEMRGSATRKQIQAAAGHLPGVLLGNQRVAFSPVRLYSKRNQEVAYEHEQALARPGEHRPDPEEYRPAGAAVSGLAGPHRSGPVRPMVRHPAGRPVRSGPDNARPDHYSEVRAPCLRGTRPADGAGAALLLALAAGG